MRGSQSCTRGAWPQTGRASRCVHFRDQRLASCELIHRARLAYHMCLFEWWGPCPWGAGHPLACVIHFCPVSFASCLHGAPSRARTLVTSPIVGPAQFIFIFIFLIPHTTPEDSSTRQVLGWAPG